MKVSFGSLWVDFELKKVDFGPLRVNHSWHRGVDFRTPGRRFLVRVISSIRQFVDSRNLDLMQLTLTIRESNWELWKSSLGLKESILDLWALGIDFYS